MNTPKLHVYLNDEDAELLLSQAEEVAGARFPEDYRVFQKQRNHANSYRLWFQFETPAEGRRRLGFHTLDSLPKLTREQATLKFMIETARSRQPGEGRIPSDAIPIGTCWDNEHVLLFIAGARRGQVWIKTYQTLDEGGPDNPEDDLFFVSPSFGDFLDHLEKPRPDDER